MPLSWNEIKTRALAFSKEWQNETSEKCRKPKPSGMVFSIFMAFPAAASPLLKNRVKKLGEKFGYIDLFWKGVLIVRAQITRKKFGFGLLAGAGLFSRHQRA